MLYTQELNCFVSYIQKKQQVRHLVLIAFEKLLVKVKIKLQFHYKHKIQLLVKKMLLMS